MKFWPRGKFRRRDAAENFLHLRQRLRRFHVADDDEDGVVGHIPGVVEFSKHGIGGLVEGRPRAQSGLIVRRAFEHGRQQFHVEDIFGIGQILRDFLFDGAALLVPKCFVRQKVPHPGGLDVQGDVQILGGRGEKILRDRVLRVGVEIAAHGRRNVRQLVRRQSRAAAKHHVLGGVGRAGKVGGAFVRTDAVIDHRGDHRRERVADNDDLQAVREGGAQHILAVGSFIGGRAADRPPGQREEEMEASKTYARGLIFSRHKFGVETTIEMRRSSARKSRTSCQ